MASEKHDALGSLLGTALWLAGLGAFLAAWYGVSSESFVSLALAQQLTLLGAAAWAAHALHAKRVLLSVNAEGAAVVALRESVQSQATVIGGAAAVIGLFAFIQLLQQTISTDPKEPAGIAFGAVCLAVGFVWMVFARAFQSVPADEFPESAALAHAFREAQWFALAAAFGAIGSTFHPPLLLWVGRLLLVWVLAICVETLLRLAVPLLLPLEPSEEPAAPIGLFLREVAFASGTPIGSMIRTLEARYGVSLRSSWAITFVKWSAPTIAALLLLLLWGLTSLSIVELNQLGVREHFGRLAGAPLPPGLHVKLPWPFGRIRTFAVKNVRQTPIGFVESDEPADKAEPRALLWTRAHAKEEFGLVLGGGTELVAVNALVYYKIDEEPTAFFDYVYRQSNPDEALVALAYRALTEQTRGRTLDEVLSSDRAAFARRTVELLRQQAREARLGIEVVDFALLNLHPPLEVADSYLDVINARLDARRRVIEAGAEKETAVLGAQTRGSSAVAAARAEGSRRIGGAVSESSEFLALGQAISISPQTFRVRLWVDALERALTGQRLFVVDQSLLNEGGELYLDTRRQLHSHLPSVDGIARPAAVPGAK